MKGSSCWMISKMAMFGVDFDQLQLHQNCEFFSFTLDEWDYVLLNDDNDKFQPLGCVIFLEPTFRCLIENDPFSQLQSPKKLNGFSVQLPVFFLWLFFKYLILIVIHSTDRSLNAVMGAHTCLALMFGLMTSQFPLVTIYV